MDCIFCKIVNGEIPSNKIYEDEDIIAFNDLYPQAPIHFLVIPKKHIESCNFLDRENSEVVAKIFVKIAELAKEMGFDESGYRIINNCNDHGGQTVKHLHFHVLAGRSLNWPPG
ncbi:histidine triad nucleotide-binding protein [Parvimonas sp. G1604]|uniref:histidine triad nucleotide-binding protein n=1 Tax=Parvimonas sp. G1604 TaxID=3388845 RepID=UPI003981037A